MRPSAKKKLKIDYNSLKKIKKNFIYASLAGIDQATDTKYFDVIAQAESGMMSLTGINEPTKIGPAVVDAYSGLNLAFGIASALYKRESTGKGSNISVSMLASAMNLLEHNLIETSVTGTNPNLPGNQDNAIAPFGVYKTKDTYIVLAIGTDLQWKMFADNYKLHALNYETNAKRLKNNKKLTQDIENAFSNSSTNAIIEDLHRLNIPCAKVNTLQEVLQNKWMYASGALVKQKGFVTTGYSVTFHNEHKLEETPAPALDNDNNAYEV